MTPRSTAHKRQYVLDANALVGFFEDRPGCASRVRSLFERSLRDERPLLICAVTWGEVFYVEWRSRGEAGAYEAEKILPELPILVVPVDQMRATRAAAIKQKHSLGYADSFAAELAIGHKAWLVTADPEFSKMGKSLSLYALPRFGR